MSGKQADDFEKGLKEILSAGKPAKKDKTSSDIDINKNSSVGNYELQENKTAVKVFSIIRVLAVLALLFFLLIFVNNIANL